MHNTSEDMTHFLKQINGKKTKCKNAMIRHNCNSQSFVTLTDRNLISLELLSNVNFTSAMCMNMNSGIHGVQPTDNMAAKLSLLVACHAEAFPGRPTNSSSTLPREGHLVGNLESSVFIFSIQTEPKKHPTITTITSLRSQQQVLSAVAKRHQPADKRTVSPVTRRAHSHLTS